MEEVKTFDEAWEISVNNACPKCNFPMEVGWIGLGNGEGILLMKCGECTYEREVKFRGRTKQT